MTFMFAAWAFISSEALADCSAPAAFFWCINELFRMGRDGRLDDAIHVLYVSPLKALNNDIQENLIEPLLGQFEQTSREIAALLQGPGA